MSNLDELSGYLFMLHNEYNKNIYTLNFVKLLHALYFNLDFINNSEIMCGKFSLTKICIAFLENI